MKKVTVIGLALIVVLMLVVAIPAMAAPGGKDNPANDNPNNLYLYEKDANFDIVWDGAWGKLNFKLSDTTIRGVFNGHELVAGEDYTLVKYNGWPSVTVIGSGTADASGDVHIKGIANLGPGGEGVGEYKIWLVLSEDLTGSTFNDWNPSAYLFEHNLIP